MKKFVSVFMVLIMSITLAVPAFAQTETNTERKIQQEIARVEEEVYASIYKQLEAQGMTEHMDIYKEILAPKIEMEVRAQYGGISSRSVTAQKSYTLKNGGVINYIGSLGAPVMCLYMTPSQFNSWVKQYTSKSTLQNLIMQILTKLPTFGKAFDVLFKADFKLTTIGKNAVNKAGGWAHVIRVTDTTGSMSTTITGWTNHPTAVVPGDASSVAVKYGNK